MIAESARGLLPRRSPEPDPWTAPGPDRVITIYRHGLLQHVVVVWDLIDFTQWTEERIEYRPDRSGA